MIEGDVYTLLSPLVARGLCTPSEIDQLSEPERIPVWPAIRYTIIDSINEESICGTDTVDTDDVRIQIDVVAKTYGAMITLRDQVIAAFMTYDPPPARQSLFHTKDEVTKTHRAVLDYVFQQSSE